MPFIPRMSTMDYSISIKELRPLLSFTNIFRILKFDAGSAGILIGVTSLNPYSLFSAY
jgi:hypothetical protein